MAKKPKMTVKAAVEAIVNAGLSVMENANNSNGGDTTHLTIAGGVRFVEFYPSTLRGYANPVNGQFEMAKFTGIENAIRLAKTGSV